MKEIAERKANDIPSVLSLMPMKVAAIANMTQPVRKIKDRFLFWGVENDLSKIIFLIYKIIN
jgi:hypothetical protein